VESLFRVCGVNQRSFSQPSFSQGQEVTMTSKERMLLALNREVPDRVPATVHQWQDYHLKKYLAGMDALAAFRHFGLDAAIPAGASIPQEWPNWRTETRESRDAEGHRVLNISFITPEGTLTETDVIHETTGWCTEYPIKRPEDVDLLDKYQPVPKLDHAALAREYERVGDDGIVRGFVWGHHGGCWQHAAAIFGLEKLILATHHDPAWVHHFLRVLQKKKLQFIAESLPGAKFDLIETGGGQGSSTCISPKLFREFCLPYDREQHDAMRAVGQKSVYHTCGGMMPILELIADTHCDASETLTPPEMGGDARPAELKQRIGDKVCLIGGVNQFQVLDLGTREQVREHVRSLFRDFGPGGGYMMSPSDHFFETPVESLKAYAKAARECRYD
jgi:uroporphyrinogen-III decarboxylase